ncbi:hypothetical protein HGI81_05865 [Olsenella sp. KGMB02461]|nr:hypothetical protein [Olsenella sp. KGMB02461]
MNAIVCDIVAWMYFASQLPATPLNAAQAQERLSRAIATAGAAKSIRSLPWWKSFSALGHSLIAAPSSQEIPMHLLVTPKHFHGAQKGIVLHTISGPLPDGFLFDIHAPKPLDSLQIVGPAGYVILRSRHLDMIDLAVLISTLCGDYLCAPHQNSIKYLASPLCTVEVIKAIADRMPAQTRGVSTVKDVLPYVASRAHSPMETVIQLALCLPKKLGGCGLPLPSLNTPIEISEEHSYILNGSKHIIPDGLWLNKQICYEYDSYQEHDTQESQIERDRRRRDVMERLGFQMVVIDRSVCRDELLRNLTFERLSSMLGVSFDWSSEAQRRRRKLWAFLRTNHLCW